MNSMLSCLLVGCLVSSVMRASAEGMICIYMRGEGTGVVCEADCKQYDYCEYTNYLSVTTQYDGKVTVIFMSAAPDLKVKYVSGLLSCLRNAGFKSVFWDCDAGDGEPNLRHELPLWFFTRGNFGGSVVANTFDNAALGLVAFHPWEKTYIPFSIEDAVTTIKNNLTPEKKDKLRSMSVEQLRYESCHGLGLWMEENWVLAGEQSRLHDYCYRVKHISNPGEISWVILSLLQRTLMGEQVEWSANFTELAKSAEGKVDARQGVDSFPGRNRAVAK